MEGAVVVEVGASKPTGSRRAVGLAEDASLGGDIAVKNLEFEAYETGQKLQCVQRGPAAQVLWDLPAPGTARSQAVAADAVFTGVRA